jgi:uncharacterized protein
VTPIDVSAAEARRIALHAQGLGRPRPTVVPTLRHVRAAVARLGAVQIDAVNVLVRAHYLTLFSRLGPYPVRLLDELTDSRHHAFEYWGHAASILPIELHPLVRWRMAREAEDKNWAAFRARVERERPGYLAAVEREVAERGPIAFTDLADPARRERPTRYAASTILWDRGSDGKTALEGLFNAGRLAAAGRKGFQRRYDLAERVIPAEVLALPTPSREDAQRELVLHAARALGVATVNEIRYYFFLAAVAAKARIRELVDNGDLLPARVEGWDEPAYLDPAARRGRVRARALLSPFDSLLWERDRVERLFRFRHSFELYIKPPQRRYGYFVLPFLLGESLVARVDLKADRARRTLLVLGVFGEPGMPADTATELAAELRDLARWLDLDSISVADGSGADPLSRDLGRLLRLE